MYTAPVKLPRTIGQYEFVELLGSGSFGAVYRAVLRGELGFEQEVAIKVLDAARAHLDQRLIESLANEARILSRVQHPNIVQARHFVAISDDALGETWALVLELVRGQSLRKLLHADRQAAHPLPIQAPLHALSELADGLHFAHRLTDERGNPVGLVHRDLKPENIHVTNEGRIKILDFGIAWAKRRHGESTRGGWTKGTPAYMSPEQIRGEPLDARSDLYSLGVIGFEMVSGERYVPASPDPDPLGPATEVRFAQREPLLVEALRRRHALDTDSGAVRELVALLRGLLAQDKRDRPGRAGEVFDRLEGLVQLHRPSRGRGRLRRWVEQQNQRERDGIIDETNPLQRPLEPVRSTVILRGGGDDEDTSFIDGPDPTGEQPSRPRSPDARPDDVVIPTIGMTAARSPDPDPDEEPTGGLSRTLEIPALDGDLASPGWGRWLLVAALATAVAAVLLVVLTH